MNFEHIKRVGFELEGGWDESPDFDIHADGSVNVSAHCTGEYSSEPELPETAIRILPRYYPDKVDSSCGLHLHISFKGHDRYMKVMSKTFFDGLLKMLETYARENPTQVPTHFMGRLKGQNSFCRKVYQPDTQAVQRTRMSCRYSAVNYCFAMHGTMEVRVLPMFQTAEQAVKAVRLVLEFTERYLKRNLNEKPRIEVVSVNEEVPVLRESIVETITVAKSDSSI